jgi:putative nucleotidyltransferase with HDIG domain
MSNEKKELKFSYIDHEREILLESTLEKYLVSIGKINLFQQLSYILKEMAGNANKANLKRIHFHLKNLDIKFPTHYFQGMKTFKHDLALESEKYFSEAERLKYFIYIALNIEGNNFIMVVKNNHAILPFEKKRIHERFKKAAKFKSMEEALGEGLDTEEGAGFGLILTILMLRKLGLDERVFTISDESNLTEAKVIIPLSLLNREQEDYIADLIRKEIKQIPQFPEHIIELQKKLSNPNAKFSDLSEIINKDPSLIADLLKVANSSMYMLPKKIQTIEEAVRQIGFEGVKYLVIMYSAQKILMDKYKLSVIKKTMQHSAEVAFYAYEIGRKLNYNDILEEIYIAAILHDFGKIIINSIKPDVFEKITKLCNQKGISSTIVENLTDGYNHSIIGAKLTEKWNFSEELIQTIRYHHIPLESKADYQKLVFVVYLANILYYYRRKEFNFSNINYQVLSFFNLTKKKDLDRLFDPIAEHLDTKKIKREEINNNN